MARGCVFALMLSLWMRPGLGGAEDRGRHEIQVGLGAERLGSRDEMGSPFLYRGEATPAWLRYEYRGVRNHVGGEGLGAFSTLRAGRATENRHQAEAILVDVRFWWQRVLVDEGRHRLMLGGELYSSTFYRSYQYDRLQIGMVEIWDAPVTGNLRAEMTRRLGPVQIGAMMSIPVGGWIMRPNYAVRGDERMEIVEQKSQVLTFGRWASWPMFQLLDARVTARLQLGAVGLSANWAVQAFRYQVEPATRALRQRAMVGILWQW